MIGSILTLAADVADATAGDTAVTPIAPDALDEGARALSAGDMASVVLLLCGVALCALSAVGILRMPDLYTRMQASAKAGTLGVACIILATAAHFASLSVGVKVGMIMVFIFLTTPAAAHLIARAAYFVEVPLWKRTAYDDLHGCYTDDHRLVNMPEGRATRPIAQGETGDGEASSGGGSGGSARATG